jgi:lipoate-protein ligase A
MAGPTLRLIREPCLDGAANMARDEALLLGALRGGAPSLRLYGWGVPTLSLGAHQPVSDIDREACRRRGVDLVRRPTGGGAVLHHRELTYAVAGRLGSPPFPTSVIAVYEWIAGALIGGLARLGVAAEASRGTFRGRAPADCFGAPSARELTVGGRKLVGSAQLRRRGAFLQHGSLLLALDRDLLGEILRPERDEHGRAGDDGAGRCEAPGSVGAMGPKGSGPSPTTLGELLGRTLPWEEAADAIAAGFEHRIGLPLAAGGLAPEEAEESERLRAWKYLDACWTLQGTLRPGPDPF